MGPYKKLFGSVGDSGNKNESIGPQKVEGKRIAQEHERRASFNREQSIQSTIAAPNTETNPIVESISEELCAMACQAKGAFFMKYEFDVGDQQIVINAMNKLLLSCYGQKGNKLLNVSPENCEPIGLAFADIAIYSIFNYRDMNSVAAENAFYCLARNFIAKNNKLTTPILFVMLLRCGDLLEDILISTHCTIVEKSVGMPIDMFIDMMWGGPFQVPHLAEFIEQALSKSLDIMAYLIQFFYDLDKSEYKIPTDLPDLRVNNRDIEQFKTLVSGSGSSVKKMQTEGQKYFYTMFEECEDTLRNVNSIISK